MTDEGESRGKRGLIRVSNHKKHMENIYQINFDEFKCKISIKELFFSKLKFITQTSTNLDAIATATPQYVDLDPLPPKPPPIR